MYVTDEELRDCGVMPISRYPYPATVPQVEPTELQTEAHENPDENNESQEEKPRPRVEITCVQPLPHDVLTIDELSEFIQVPVATIRRWRVKGYGPRAALMQKELRYVREDVIAWLRFEAGKDERCSREAYQPRPARLK